MIVVNPLGNGGLSLTKLAKATASASDVILGKTFYAGANPLLRTGSLTPHYFNSFYKNKYDAVDSNYHYCTYTVYNSFTPSLVICMIGYVGQGNVVWVCIKKPYDWESENFSVADLDVSMSGNNVVLKSKSSRELRWVWCYCCA